MNSPPNVAIYQAIDVVKDWNEFPINKADHNGYKFAITLSRLLQYKNSTNIRYLWVS